MAKIKSIEECHFNAEPFIDIRTPEVAYILGLLWADGYIDKTNDRQSFRIAIECSSKDLDTLIPTFLRSGKWNINYRTRPNRQAQTCISTSNRYLWKFLDENNYSDKSGVSANKILSKIPSHLKHYWFRGIIDGDGSFYYKNSTKQFNCSSSKFQDWGFFTSLFEELEIRKFVIRENVQLTNESSSGIASAYSDVRITNQLDIIKLGEYIYQNYEIDSIGLRRKFDTFLKIKNHKVGVRPQPE